MSTIENLITSPQLKEIVDAVTSKSKALFVPKSTYEAKVSELESTISDLEARILDLETFHYPGGETEPIEDNEDEEP